MSARNVTCCASFDRIKHNFEWFTFKDKNTTVMCMPVLKSDDPDDNLYRVNHCPVCGTNIRGIEIEQDA